MDVLIVEDEAPLADTIARSLRARGHDVRVQGTGEGALAEIDRAVPNVLLLDINLPDITGWDVLRRASKEHRSRMAVIAISAGSMSQQRVNEMQPDRCLEKPFPMDALVRMLGELDRTSGEKGEQ